MATNAPRKPSSNPSPRGSSPAESEPVIADHWILRGFDAIYRFLASVKLAVLCILSLAAVLAGATIFESFHTMAASRQYIYGHPAFAILLAFLGINIFCAATIRYPWKKRQTGFVVTHVGLLVVLVGAFISLRFGQDGQLGMPEGTSSGEIVRTDDLVVRVEKLDPDTGKPSSGYVLPFEPGVFAWETEALKTKVKDPKYQREVFASRMGLGASLLGLVGFALLWAIKRPSWITPGRGALVTSLLVGATAGLSVVAAMTPSAPKIDVLTDPADPFVIAVKDYLPSSLDRLRVAEPAPRGTPVARIALLVTPPGSNTPINAFEGDAWFGADNPRLNRVAKTQGGALVVYQTVAGPESEALIDDFLNPPKNPLEQRVARVHYKDKNSAERVYEWVLGDDLKQPTITLPDTDIALTFSGFAEEEGAGLRGATGDDVVSMARFEARQGAGEPIKLIAVASLPTVPNSLQGDESPVRIGYFHPPRLVAGGGPMAGRKAQIEILSDDRGRFYFRAFNLDGTVGTPGPIAIGAARPIATKSRMGAPLVLKVEDYLPAGILRNVYIDTPIPFAQRENAIPAIQAEMTVNGEIRKLSLLRTMGTSIEGRNWETVEFPDGVYRVSLDFDRQPFRPSPFTIKLKKFEPGKDPGSGSFATYRSDIELTDPALGLSAEPHVITMNEPLTHRGWTFYQSSFNRVRDPDTGERDAVYASFFQVHYDPAWQVIYVGCLLVVVGTFLQFYMRAGVFTDGGKREREKADARAARDLAKRSGKPLPKAEPAHSAPDLGRLEDL